MGIINCAVYLVNLADFCLFSNEFDFLKHLLKSNTYSPCCVLQRLSLVHKFVDNLFVMGLADFLRVLRMWTKTLLASIVHPKMSCELSCMSNDISCSFLDLAINQSPQGIANAIG